MSHLDVDPKDLRFRADSKRQATILYLSNRSQERVAFKVKTTAPKRYCVKPSAEVIEPAAVMEVKVFMQTSKDLTPSAIAECRDKFLIQSTPVPSGWSMKTDDAKAAEMFSRKTNSVRIHRSSRSKSLTEEKLMVTLEAPPPPPSPVPEGSEALEAGSPAYGNASSASLPIGGASAGQTIGTSGANGASKAVPMASRGVAQPPGGTPTVSKPAAPTAGGAAPKSAAATAASGAGGDLRSENRKLREQLALLELKSGENAAKASSGFRVIHLIPVALVAFLIGYFF